MNGRIHTRAPRRRILQAGSAIPSSGLPPRASSRRTATDISCVPAHPLTHTQHEQKSASQSRRGFVSAFSSEISSGPLSRKRRISVRLEQCREISWVLDFHPNHPAVAVGVRVYQRRFAIQPRIDLSYFACEGGEEFGASLDGFDGPNTSGLAKAAPTLGSSR